jgi:hypothetical protein
MWTREVNVNLSSSDGTFGRPAGVGMRPNRAALDAELRDKS